jgi:hypothetical protein
MAALSGVLLFGPTAAVLVAMIQQGWPSRCGEGHRRGG